MAIYGKYQTGIGYDFRWVNAKMPFTKRAKGARGG